MVLLNEIGQRFAPLEAEMTQRAMHEMMTFSRKHGENIDALLTRFDMVRNRAIQRGGLAMTHQGLGWVLMRACGISTEQWDRILDVNQGQMPRNEEELQRIGDRLRRMGHLYENGGHMKHGAPNDYFTDGPPASGGDQGPTF